MRRIALLLLLALAVNVAKGELQGGTSTNCYPPSDFISRNVVYSDFNRLQNVQNLRDYDVKLNYFEEHYRDRVQAIIIQYNLTAASIMQNDERLEKFQVLGDYARKCVSQYRHHFPTVAKAKSSIIACAIEAENQLNDMLQHSYTIRNTLEHYYKTDFENQLASCGKNDQKTTGTYASCLTSVMDDVNHYTTSNQKMFESRLRTAKCTADLNIKKALNCSFGAQTGVTALITEVNGLIRSCVNSQQIGKRTQY